MTESTAAPKHVERVARLRWVPIAEMAVTPTAQRDLRTHRVAHLVSNFDPEQIGNPTVNHRDGVYYVVDGQHRIEAMKAVGWGDQAVQCWTYEGMSEAEEAESFLKLNDKLTVSTFDKFKVGVQAGRVAESDVDRIVRFHGLHIARGDAAGVVGCPGTLLKVYKMCGPGVLSRTLNVVSQGFGDVGLDAYVIEGVALMLARYGQEIDTVRAVERFGAARGGVAGLLNRAQTIRAKQGGQKAHCVAAAAVEIYNASRGGKKLASWWREDGELELVRDGGRDAHRRPLQGVQQQ